jgi:hypothetical protein
MFPKFVPLLVLLIMIEHRSSTQHCNADGLSRLPLATTEDEENESVC